MTDHVSGTWPPLVAPPRLEAAIKYLEALVEDGILRKLKIGRPNYYINIALNHVLVGDTTSEEGQQA
jgi:hypothetical protein